MIFKSFANEYTYLYNILTCKVVVYFSVIYTYILIQLIIFTHTLMVTDERYCVFWL